MALLQFRPDPDVPERRYVELENGCWVSVLQRVVPNPEDPGRVRTAAYSYSYSLGPDPDEEWLRLRAGKGARLRAPLPRLPCARERNQQVLRRVHEGFG